jgi:hypothetical protein
MQQAIELERAGRLDEAEAAIDRCLQASPDMGEALHLKGVLAFKRGRQQEGAALMERSMQLGTPQPHYYRNLCEVYRVLGRYDEALNAGRRAHALLPNDPHALANLAILHYERGESDATIACCERALELDPTLPSAHFELAEALLLRGEFERGWEEYEWRYKIPNAGTLMPKTDRPQWDGAPLGDQTLLLIADQGFGDSIQFCRYMPWVAERCSNVVVACSHELRPLLAQQPGISRLIERWEDCPKFHVFCPLSGLPRLHGTRGHNVPATVPYLAVKEDAARSYKQRLDALVPKGYRRVGIVWAGRPTHANDRNRSVSLTQLKSIFEVPETAFIVLQKGPRAADIGNYFGTAPLINMAAECNDFEDTLAVISALDLVVTVDTAVGHLTGALGKPAWIMLPFAPDWRWLLKRTDTPWYPSVRLFRQPSPRRWDLVTADVARALHDRE